MDGNKAKRKETPVASATGGFTIKTYMVAFLLVLSAVSSFQIAGYYFLAQSVIAAATAAVIDLLITYARERKTFLPSSALISGLFIGMILPLSQFVVIVLACLLAMLSKHAITLKKRHIFNPAAFGTALALLIFGLSSAWWGAATLLVIPLGLIIVYKQKKWLLVVPFVLSHYALSFLASGNLFLLDTTMLFFAFFMLLEPVTSTHTKRAMVAQGVVVALLAAAAKLFLPVDALLLPLLASNLFVQALNKKLK